MYKRVSETVKIKASNKYRVTSSIYVGNFLSSYYLLATELKKYLSLKDPHLVIFDKALAESYLPSLTESLKQLKVNFKLVDIEGLEKNKSLSTLEFILNKAIEYKLTRNSTIIALGGGVITDISGLTASLLFRGISYINIPTTLLAMVDASIGGKTGIDTKEGKNLIGTYHLGRAIIIDPFAITSLPTREVLSGFAEVIKIALIGDKKLFNYLYKHYDLLLNIDSDFLQKIILKAAKLKLKFVKKDILDEKGKRALLNLGHTFGHALERLTDYDGSLLHGEAVAIGTCLAVNYSADIGLLTEKQVKRVTTLIKKVGLPTSFRSLNNPKLNAISNEKLLENMYNDKKNFSNQINLILLKDIGKAKLVYNVNKDNLLNFLNKNY